MIVRQIIHSLLAGESLLSYSKQPDVWNQPSLLFSPTQNKASGSRRKAFIYSVTRIKILSVCSLCTCTPMCSLSVMRLMKHGDLIWSVFKQELAYHWK